jgi:hypothetical protein
MVFTALHKPIIVRNFSTVNELALVTQLPYTFALNFRLHVAVADAGN